MTYTIIIKDGDKMGIGVVSGSIAVGSRVPWIKYGVGAVATQAHTNVNLGPMILSLLEKYNAEEALKLGISQDPQRELRQVGVMDWQGRASVYTGSLAFLERGEIVKKNKLCMGNLLKSMDVVNALDAGSDISESVEERILNALEEAHQAGGDARGDRSAVLIVVGKKEPYDRLVDIRVDYSHNPIKKLRGIYEML